MSKMVIIFKLQFLSFAPYFKVLNLYSLESSTLKTIILPYHTDRILKESSDTLFSNDPPH